MTKEDLKQRFKELLTVHPPLDDIQTLFNQALDTGALDLKRMRKRVTGYQQLYSMRFFAQWQINGSQFQGQIKKPPLTFKGFYDERQRYKKHL
jgi:hypothetical protein